MTITQDGICGTKTEWTCTFIIVIRKLVPTYIDLLLGTNIENRVSLPICKCFNLLIKNFIWTGCSSQVCSKHEGTWDLQSRLHTQSKMLGNIPPGNSPCFPWPLSPELCPIAASTKSLRQCRWWDLQIHWLRIIDFSSAAPLVGPLQLVGCILAGGTAKYSLYFN